jgi:chromosome transmission fidelity protein 8
MHLRIHSPRSRTCAQDKKPTLMIGHHLLEGKYANLPKPLAVLKKVTSSAPDEEDAEDGPVKQKSPEWDMLAIVKRKIVFSKRPMPIVNYKPASTAAAAAPTS